MQTAGRTGERRNVGIEWKDCVHCCYYYYYYYYSIQESNYISIKPQLYTKYPLNFPVKVD
jgi:hypothetical protein